MLFEPLPTDRPPRESEGAVLDDWKQRKVFEKTLERTKDGPPFVFYEGPPTANGTPHHGHVLTRVVKDLFPRYKTMDGFSVARKAGWDTHGLPVEVEVEKQIGSTKKSDIEAYGVAKFVAACKESVWKYKAEWERMTERIGFWLDLEHPYVTYTPDYVESVWWALSRIHAKGLLSRGYKILPWCARCGTGLSAGEVGQGYEEVQDPAITVAFKLRDEDARILAWTTTPWTLVSNVALVVGADLEYAYVRSGDRTYVLAADRVEAVLGKNVEVLRRLPGRELAGRSYEPLFDYHGKLDKPAHRVIEGDFVTLGEGTGVVHAAPAFGEDDYRVCTANGLAFVQLVKPDGTFVESAGPLAGKWVKDADKDIARDLKQRGLLVKQETYVHEYPHCWRCGTPLIYYAREGWFIQTTRLKDRLVASNRAIVWAPEHIREGRFGKFLEENKDWALSRERYWGTPLPIWVCESCGHETAIGSRLEWLEHGGAVQGTPLGRESALALDPHKPAVDDVALRCAKCGGASRRVPDVIDCWFDSGAMPFAQWGYPHVEGSRERLARNYPADFISEAKDQTRGWFYTLHAIATLLRDEAPELAPGIAYKRCLVLGHVLAASGKKLSKKDKNYTPPAALIDEHGADAVRWFFYSRMTSGQDVRFTDDGVRDARRMFLLKVLNVTSAFQLWTEDKHGRFDPRPGGTPPVPLERRPALDRWVVSEQETTIQKVRAGLDAFDFHAAADVLEAFVESLSNWYVRRSRERGWSAGKPENADKWACLWTLHDVLATLAKLLAPFTPFLAEDLYRTLVRSPGIPGAQESVHLEKYPEANEARIDRELERKMALARKLAELGLRARSEAKVKVRQPLAKAFVLVGTPEDMTRASELAPVIAEELNVKEIEVSGEFDRFVSFEVKLDYKACGKKLGKQLKSVEAALKAADARSVAATARQGRNVSVPLGNGGAPVELGPTELDVRLRAREGFAAAEDGGAVVVLDTAIDTDLKREGLARELVNRIQSLRKDLDLAYTARIEVWVQGDDEVASAAREHEAWIRRETQADAIHLAAPLDGVVSKELEIEGHAVTIGLREVPGPP